MKLKVLAVVGVVVCVILGGLAIGLGEEYLNYDYINSTCQRFPNATVVILGWEDECTVFVNCELWEMNASIGCYLT